MPRLAQRLTDLACQKAKPIEKNGKFSERLLSDGYCPGLQLHVSKPAGANQTIQKTWRFKFKNEKGKWQSKNFAKYPDTSLDQAREMAGIIRQKLIAPAPVAVRKYTFEEVAESWHKWKKGFAIKGKLPSEATIRKHRGCLNLDLLPALGKMDIEDVDRAVCSDLLLKINNRSNSVADKARQVLHMILEYSINNDMRKTPIPSLKSIIGLLKPKDFEMPQDIVAEYKKCDGMTSPVMRLAMKLQHHIFLRSGEIMAGEWDEIDFNKNLWIIPGRRMKMKRKHAVPLTEHTLAILHELKALAGESKYIFPSNDGKTHMSRDSLSKAFREHHIAYTPHEVRTVAGEWLKKHGVQPYLIEVQLAHLLGGLVQQAYEVEPHLYFLEDRMKAMSLWSNFLTQGEKSI